MIDRQRQESGWSRNKAGMIKPLGSGGNWKEFFNISKDPAAKVANMLTRADLPEESWPYLFLANSLATYVENGVRKIDDEHLIFVANVAGASVGRRGIARKQALMGMTNIIAPAVLSEDGRDHRKDPVHLNRDQSRDHAKEDDE